MDPGTQSGSLKSVTLHLSVLFSHLGTTSQRYLPQRGQGSPRKPTDILPLEEENIFLNSSSPSSLKSPEFPSMSHHRPEPGGVAESAWPLLGHPMKLGKGVSLTQTTWSKGRKGAVLKGNLSCVWKTGASDWTDEKDRCLAHNPCLRGTPPR